MMQLRAAVLQIIIQLIVPQSCADFFTGYLALFSALSIYITKTKLMTTMVKAESFSIVEIKLGMKY
jgi:hypothetical protein